MQASTGVASGESWMSKLGDDRQRGARPTATKATEDWGKDAWEHSDPWSKSLGGYPSRAAKAAPPAAPEQPRPKASNWAAALGDDRAALRGRGSSGPSGGAAVAQTTKDGQSPGEWSSKLGDDQQATRSRSGPAGAKPAVPMPSSPTAPSGNAGSGDGGARRMLGIAMRSAGGDMRNNGSSTSDADGANGPSVNGGQYGSHTSVASPGKAASNKGSDANSDIQMKLKHFLLAKPGQLEQRKRTLRACVQHGGNILGEGVTLEPDVVEEAICMAESEAAPEAAAASAAPAPVASQAEASPETEAQDDWWGKNNWEDDGKWRTGGQWESQDSEAWSSDWKSSEQRWDGGDKWWESGQTDSSDQQWKESSEQQWSSQGVAEQWEQQAKQTEGRAAGNAGGAASAADVSEEDMSHRLLKYLESAKDPVKAKSVIRSTQSGVSSRVAEAAIAMYEGKDRSSVLGGGIYQ